MQLVMNPYQYDMLLLRKSLRRHPHRPVRGFRGRPGTGSGREHGRRAARSSKQCRSAPDIAGKDKANPTALLQSAILMLHHIDETEAANKIQTALEKVYAEKTTLTRDVGGTAGTRAFADAVIAAL